MVRHPRRPSENCSPPAVLRDQDVIHDDCPTPLPIVGSSRQRFIRLHAQEALLVTAMPIHPTRLRSSAAPRCELPRPGPSIGLSEKPTESASAVSKNSVRSRRPPRPPAVTSNSNGHSRANGSGNGQPRLRDQLCLLIRQYNLDPTLVKAYAADFCGTESLKDASRDLVESFVTQLAASAKKDRDGLICKLNSYAQPVEANP